MQPFLSIRGLTKTYPLPQTGLRRSQRRRTIITNLSLDIQKGEALGLVGESGCGKTTLGRSLLRLTPVDWGSIIHEGRDILSLSERAFRPVRPLFQIIFQDPALALNPRQSVGACIAEPLRVHEGLRGTALSLRMSGLLEQVGLEKELTVRLPHELSGGQRQRVAIARALATRPNFLVADEPTSSLDATLKRHIISLLLDLKRRFGLTLLLISHDLAVVAQACERVAVMYRGDLVELAPTETLIRTPAHPYTQLLLRAASYRGRADIARARANGFTGTAGASGCPFAHRCPIAEGICTTERPELLQTLGEAWAACHFAGHVDWKAAVEDARLLATG